jgi:outer membrane protein assembly factor BamB
MTAFANLVKGVALSALILTAGAGHAATYVYVSNAEDGDCQWESKSVPIMGK